METTSQVSKSHQPCEDCGSSDALAEYDDGHTYCFSCNQHRKEIDNVSNIEDYKKPEPDTRWQDRKIGGAIAEFYEVKVQDDIVYFPYFCDGVLKASKLRMPGKEHKTEGEFSKCDLFGTHTLTKAAPQRSKTIIITEGEADALAAFQMANRIPLGSTKVSDSPKSTLVPVLSIKSGAASAERDFKKNLELLERYERVFICFDNDTPGRTAAEKCAKLLSPGKAYVVNLEYNDACEYTKRGLGNEFLAHLKDTDSYTPSGIHNGADNFDRLWDEQNIKSLAFPFPDLQEKTLGTRGREIITWAAGTGVGKSSILRELQHTTSRTPN